MSVPQPVVRPFTGRHMAIIMVTFFAVVIGVNLTMATLARTSWTGLVVQNSYVASQHFNADTAKREAMLARGYQLKLSYAEGHIALLLKDKQGQPLAVSAVRLQLNRNPNEAPLTMSCANGECATAAKLAPGLWRGDLQIDLKGEETWQQAVEIMVQEK